jgi:tRNA(Leu) C34 or U34 (ribose-2'-O)-methylase TrmL
MIAKDFCGFIQFLQRNPGIGNADLPLQKPVTFSYSPRNIWENVMEYWKEIYLSLVVDLHIFRKNVAFGTQYVCLPVMCSWIYAGVSCVRIK